MSTSPMNALAVTVFALSLTALVPRADAGFEKVQRETPATAVLDVYAQNRERGIPSYVTADLPLVGYALLSETSLVELEVRRLIPGLALFVETLRVALEGDADADPETTTRNLGLVSLLDALLRTDPSALADETLAEYERVREGAGIARSSWWSRDIDYSQYTPRGRYAGDPALEGFFRAMRYVGSQSFAVTASRATGVGVEASRLQTRQGAQLARLITAEGPLRDVYENLETALDWQLGPSRELGVEPWAQTHAEIAAADNPPDDSADGAALDEEGIDALRAALLELARTQARQPRVVDGVVDLSMLEPGTSVADAMTGLRLLGAREMAEGTAVQRLLYPGTGGYTGDVDAAPFGLGRVDGRPVKAFPEARETLALLGSAALRERLDADGSSAFEGYDAAFAEARELFAGAGAAEALHHGLLRAGLHALEHRDAAELTESLLAFHTRRRYLDVLYARQPYTPVAKSLLALPVPRPGADLEPATELYFALADAAREQARHTGLGAWERYAERLDELQRISFARERGILPGTQQQAFLNALDLTLRVDGVVEGPVVVDVHTDPGSATVVQLATGLPNVVHRGPARGAHASFHEFRQPLADRLTPAVWRARLGVADPADEGGPITVDPVRKPR